MGSGSLVTSNSSDCESVKDGYSRLEDLSPSAKLVYLVLANEQKMSRKALEGHTLLSGRTVRHALSMLRDENLVEQEVDIRDVRINLYRALPVEDPDE
ncbi:hypothetical protein ACFQS4_12050 [Saliphagus sp. GCM10025317]